MAIERTLSIIKPDATARNITGQIISRLEGAGLRVIAQKRVWWTKKDARKFYDIHKEQPFFKDLISFMTSGPIVLQVLEGENAIARNREVMGATNPVDAAPGSIRKDFALNMQRNSVHGSDSAATARREIALCFKKSEIVR
jgi:nucleoside-diphosphate kinase